MDIVLVPAKLGALHHAMDGASNNTSVFVKVRQLQHNECRVW